MKYSDHELEAFLKGCESELVEYKESWAGSAPDKGREAVCAFATELSAHGKAGVLMVGVDNNGTPTGLPITDELLRTLSDIRSDGNIQPLPTISVEKRNLMGTDVAVVTVQPSDMPPVRCKGRIWVRCGPRMILANAQDERILNEKRRNRDIPFDIQPVPSSDLSALSRILFEQEYLPNAFAPDVIEANERSYEQRLSSCRMVASADNPVPTILGLLVLGISPRDLINGAYIQFLRIAGTEMTDQILDDALIDGPIGQMLRRVEEKLESHNRREVDLVTSSVEIDSMPYPPVALQQLVRNAVMHRTYEGTHAPVRIFWFDDRIEITSPGGPYGVVNSENFGSAGLSEYRNPNLADAMKVMGFVQRFGVGIQTAKKALEKNGNPELEFTIEHSHVLVTIKKKP